MQRRDHGVHSGYPAGRSLQGTPLPDATPQPLVAIPVKGFDSAKARLATAVDRSIRRSLSMALAGHTAAAVANAGFEPTIVTRDAEVIRWTEEAGLALMVEVADPELRGLDGAAAGVARRAGELARPWLILHADLPWVTGHDVGRLIDELTAGHIVLSPSYDGGTSALGASELVEFRYGPLSFHRHLAAVAARPHCVVWTPGLAFDLDAPADLRAMRADPRSAWIDELLAPGQSSDPC